MATKNYCQCGRVATRFAPDRDVDHRGRPIIMAFCPDCPTPTEIDTSAAELRDNWPGWRRRQARRDCERIRHVDFLAVVATPIE